MIGALARPDQEKVWTDPAGVPRKPIEAMDAALQRLLGRASRSPFQPGVSTYCGKEFADKAAAVEAARAAATSSSPSSARIASSWARGPRARA